MLSLEDILWVVPGVVFIYGYNRLRPSDHIDLSGWPYVFFLVLVASVTWMPAKIFFQANELSFFGGHRDVLVLIFAVLLAVVWTVVIRYLYRYAWLFPRVHDHFCLKCIELEDELVFMTLKNGKAYIGILWKYPESPRSRYESQSVSIIPFQSGFRNSEDKRVVWNTEHHYGGDDGVDDMKDMETVIPRSEIVTFGKFSEKTHQRFADGAE